LIGDFDPDTNPDGTQTRPGFFGGSGNQPIDYTATLVGDGGVEAMPAGSFSFAVDVENLGGAISGLSLDVLGGAAASFAATLEFNFDTFHTVNPTALFIGGFAIPIPLGEATITSITAVQTGDAAPVVLVPDGAGGFTFATLINAEVVIEASFLGEPIQIAPTVVPLPFAGTLTIATDGSAAVEVSIDATVDESIEPGLEPFTGIPLDIPTILPPGGTAHLLLSGTIQSVALQFSLGGSLAALADEPPPIGDLDGDDLVGGSDLGILLLAWGACKPPGPLPGGNGTCPADLTGDETVDGADLGILLLNWQL
jgi:hypothetical protein